VSQSALKECQAAVFDAYGTLFDVHAASARESAVLGEAARPLSELWRQKQLEYTWLRSLMGAYVDFWQETQDALDYAMEAHSIADDGLRRRLLELYLALDAYPDATAALAHLRKGGRKTAILTNGAPEMIDAACRASGLDRHLDRVLSVDPLRIYKPDARVYQSAVEALALPRERICFVSTNAWDARAAAHFGFRVVWLNRFGKLPDRLPGAFAEVIPSLDALPPLLGL